MTHPPLRGEGGSVPEAESGHRAAPRGGRGDGVSDVALAGGPLESWHTGLFRGLVALPVRLGVHAPDAAIAEGDAPW
jgi:hypothetical protein